MLTPKNYLKLTGILFLLIALIHLSRIVFQWGVVLAGWEMPMWFSWVGVLLAGYLSYNAFRVSEK